MQRRRESRSEEINNDVELTQFSTPKSISQHGPLNESDSITHVEPLLSKKQGDVSSMSET